MTRAQRIAALAARQHGVVTRAQLRELGVSASAVGRQLKSGRLRGLHGGVYLVGPLESDRTVDMAAVLAGGPTAVLSHTSALRTWKLLRIPDRTPVHVSVPGSGRARRPGIVFHRIDALVDDESAAVDGIRVTAPGRTIVDVASVLGNRELELALAAAEREGLVTSAELARMPDRYARRSGMAMLRALLAERTGPHFTRSEAERRCLDLLREAGLPRPHANVAVGTYELDLLWPDEGVAIEIDGRVPFVPLSLRGRPPQGQLAPCPRHRGGPAHLAADYRRRNRHGRSGGTSLGVGARTAVPGRGSNRQPARPAPRPVSGRGVARAVSESNLVTDVHADHGIEISPDNRDECGRRRLVARSRSRSGPLCETYLDVDSAGSVHFEIRLG